VAHERELAVVAHGDPAVCHAGLRLHDLRSVVDRVTAVARIVPHLPRVVFRIGDPDFAVIRGHPNSVAGGPPCAGHFELPEHFPVAVSQSSKPTRLFTLTYTR